MKQVRVTIEFMELDHNYEVVDKRYTMDTKYGAIATESMGPPEHIAHEMGSLVAKTISNHFPEFLKESK